MKREELKSTEIYARFASEVYDDFGEVETNQEYYRKEQADSVMDALEARIKSLQEENIAKDMVGAELHNENKALRHNLEDWKAENEALKQRIKELEASQPKWISVDEMLPKEGMLIHKYDGKDVWIGVANRKEANIFTHWMPLPKSPKSED